MIFCSELSAAGRSTTTSTAPHRLMVPASAVSPTVFSTGAASPVRFDSSAAVVPLAISASTGNCAPGLMSRRMPGCELFDGDFAFVSLRVKRGGGFGRVAEERTDFFLRAAQRVMFQRAGKGKQEQQRRAFRPRADAGRADGDGEHQKMHVQHALLQPFPDFLGGKPRAGEIAQGKNRNAATPTAQRTPRAGRTRRRATASASWIFHSSA